MSSPLPIKNGIAPSYRYTDNHAHLLIDFLTLHFPHISNESWLKRIHKGEVVNQLGDSLNANSYLPPFSQIFYYREVNNETIIPFEERILFQSEHLLVADKPHFLPVTPGGQFLRETLLSRLRLNSGIKELSPIHRLDKDTAGIVLFSTKAATRGAYQQLFQKKIIRKIYHAIAQTRIDLNYPHTIETHITKHPEHFFLSTESLGTPNSQSIVTLLKNNGDFSLYQLEAVTGKKHQLRLHMSNLGMPILNDVFYPKPLKPNATDYTKPLQLLAKYIEFTDPLTHKTQHFESTFNLLIT